MIIDQIRSRLDNGLLGLTDGRELAVQRRDFIAPHPRVVALIDAAGIARTINSLRIVST